MPRAGNPDDMRRGMLLTIDIGNTKTELGVWRRQALVLRLRVPTHGTEDLEARNGQSLSKVLQGSAGLRQGVGFSPVEGEGREGGIAHAFPEGQLRRSEAFEVLGQGEDDGGVFRRVGLQNHPARQFGPAGAASHLGEQLKGALRGPEVSHLEPLIGADNPHQGEARQVVALGQHLGAHQDVHLA